MGPGGAGTGQINGGFRSATPNSRYVGSLSWRGEVDHIKGERGGGVYERVETLGFPPER